MAQEFRMSLEFRKEIDAYEGQTYEGFEIARKENVIPVSSRFAFSTLQSPVVIAGSGEILSVRV